MRQKEKATIGTVCLSLILENFPLLFIFTCCNAEALKLIIFHRPHELELLTWTNLESLAVIDIVINFSVFYAYKVPNRYCRYVSINQ